jgi:hypothetical protein
MEYQNVAVANATITPPVRRFRVKNGFRALLSESDIPCRDSLVSDGGNDSDGECQNAHNRRDDTTLGLLSEMRKWTL